MPQLAQKSYSSDHRPRNIDAPILQRERVARLVNIRGAKAGGPIREIRG
jgi:hypothetical protein